MASFLPARYRRYWPVAAVGVAGLVISGTLGWELHREAVALDRQRLARLAKVFLDELDGRVEKTELLLRLAQDYLGAQPEVTPALFRTWCRKHNLSVNLAWLHGLAYYTNRNAGAWRRELGPDPMAWTAEEARRFKGLAGRTPVKLDFACGFTVGSGRQWPTNYQWSWDFERTQQTNDWYDIDRTVSGNSVRTTRRQTVILDRRAGALSGAALVTPLYEPERDELLAGPMPRQTRIPTSVWNWNLCRGVLVAPIDYVKLEQQIWGRHPREVGLEIFASRTPTPETWLNGTNGQPVSLAAGFRPYLSTTVRWRMYGRHWSVTLYTLPLFEAQSPRRMAWLALSTGAGLTMLTTVLVGFILHRREQLERMRDEVIEARDALVMARRERERLGHDLHDGAIQSLYAIQLGLTRTAEKVKDSLPAASRVLHDTRQRVDEVIAELRRFILAGEREEKAGESVGLDRVLASTLERLQPTTVARLQLEADPGAARRLSLPQVVQLTQIARGALANALRHGQPTRVSIRLQAHEGQVRLEVSDDGRGFDPAAVNGGGMGFKTMRKRAAEAGGHLQVESQPGRGTRVIAQVPAVDEAAAAGGDA